MDELRGSVRRRIMSNMDLGKMGTTLAWFEDFRRDTTRVPFVPLEGADSTALRRAARALRQLAETAIQQCRR